MPKIKLTKSELKAQRDALKQFTRFLPTLQLKKQQLQMEMSKCREQIAKIREADKKLRRELESWQALFADTDAENWLLSHLKLEEIITTRSNIAGVDVPVFKEASFSVETYDLFLTPVWYDDAVRALRELLELRAKREIIEEQYRLIGDELRVTTQRVNLFEKVMIPQAKNNIRSIQIYLGDQQVAAVGRSKIAKRKMQEVAA